MTIHLSPDAPLDVPQTLARYRIWGEDPSNRLGDGVFRRVLALDGDLHGYAVRWAGPPDDARITISVPGSRSSRVATAVSAEGLRDAGGRRHRSAGEPRLRRHDPGPPRAPLRAPGPGGRRAPLRVPCSRDAGEGEGPRPAPDAVLDAEGRVHHRAGPPGGAGRARLRPAGGLSPRPGGGAAAPA